MNDRWPVRDESGHTGQNSVIEENLSRMLDGPYGTKRDLIIGHTEQKGDIDKNCHTGQPETGLKRAISSCESKCVLSLSISSVITTNEQYRLSVAHKLNANDKSRHVRESAKVSQHINNNC